ncbi:MAG: PDZ domain-containing protein, partial [Halieaceae bacterium]
MPTLPPCPGRSLIRVIALCALWATHSWALTPSSIQGETLVKLIDTLEERHYEKRSYDDVLSALHLNAYIESLDPQKMFFTAADIEDFGRYRSTLDDLGREGELAPAFMMFNRYQTALKARLEDILDTMQEQVDGFDFTVDEYLPLDSEDLAWAESAAVLDDRWRKRLKSQVLSLRLADKAPEDIVPTLERRYKNQLNRLDQYNERDVFAVYANSLTKLYDPHTSYFSPRRAENFDINMSLSFDGIGAVLQVDDEFTKVVRLVPAGPADKQGVLRPSDLIIGVGQGDDGAIEDVIGWRLDEVVDLIRGPRETTVRLEVIPDKGKMDQRHVIANER